MSVKILSRVALETISYFAFYSKQLLLVNNKRAHEYSVYVSVCVRAFV